MISIEESAVIIEPTSPITISGVANVYFFPKDEKCKNAKIKNPFIAVNVGNHKHLIINDFKKVKENNITYYVSVIRPLKTGYYELTVMADNKIFKPSNIALMVKKDS